MHQMKKFAIALGLCLAPALVAQAAEKKLKKTQTTTVRGSLVEVSDGTATVDLGWVRKNGSRAQLRYCIRMDQKELARFLHQSAKFTLVGGRGRPCITGAERVAGKKP